MDPNSKFLPLDSYELGSHISCIYRTDDELFSLIIPFFIDGLNIHNKCLFIYNDYSLNDIINKFKKYNFDLNPDIKAGNFIYLSPEDVYQKQDGFNPDILIPNIVHKETEALESGFTGLRIAAEAKWIAEDMSVFQKLIKYEASVNEFIDYSFITAACIYKEGLYDKKSLAELVINHPKVYLYNKLVDNKYYNLPKTQENLTVSYDEIVRSFSSA